jgi:hypothetical protein
VKKLGLLLVMMKQGSENELTSRGAEVYSLEIIICVQMSNIKGKR